jgi:hypothetical protein
LAANVRHNSRVHLIAPLPSLIHLLGRATHIRHDKADVRI